MSDIVDNVSGRLVGRAFSHYRIIAEIGEGAMGRVYKAEDTRLARIVALKTYGGDACCSEETRRMVLDEARAAASVHHPNICTIYEVDEVDGIPFIAMAFLKGTAVSELVRRKPIPTARAVGIAIQAARGLEAAHRSGVVHRDVKTENMIVDDDGHVVITDFGVAKREGHIDPQLNAQVGTAAYMSPEQASATPVDHRTDIWSLGVCLFEMLSGRMPFGGDYVQSVIYSILSEDPPSLLDVAPGTPESVARIVSRALAKDPDTRYPSMTEMVADLERVTGQTDGTNGAREDAPSIAVLPLTDLSEGGDNGYFCDGMSEEIINVLTHLGGFRVVSRTSSFAFRGKEQDIREIGRQLGVEAVLEGSVRKSGDKARITVQLIDVTTGYHLLSEQFDMTLEDVFGVQDQIARKIADTLEVRINEADIRRAGQSRTTSVEAYDAYLRGRMLFYRMTRQGILAACDMFERAIERDPDYALAHSGLADCYSYTQMYFDRDKRNLRLADIYSKMALRLNPHLAEARASRGLALSMSGRYDEAEVEFQSAIGLDPRLYEAYYFYARSSFAAGELEKAVEMYRKASDVNPDDYQSPSLLGFTLRSLGRYDEAVDASQRSLDVLKRHLDLYPLDSRAWYLGASSLLDLGHTEKATEWADKAMAINPDDPYNTYGGACFFSRVGDVDRAIEFFAHSIKNGFAHADWIDNDNDLDPIRHDPRFIAIRATLDEMP